MLQFFQSFVGLCVLGFLGAFVHFVRQNISTFSQVNKAALKTDAIAFWDWLIGISPVKSLATWVLLVGGLFVLTLLGFRPTGFGLLVAPLYGYFLDSILKRIP